MTDMMPEAMFEDGEATKASKNYIPLVIIGAIVLVGVVWFTMMKSAQTAPAPIATPAAMIESASLLETLTINIDAGSYYFTPNEIRAKKGQKIIVVLNSKDMMHNFTVDEFNVVGPVTNAGQTSTVEFTPDKTGTFEFYCAVGDHRAKGQVGTLIVEE
jgi:heme/copper-type cytochrome/quinol oxidase subunit 2